MVFRSHQPLPGRWVSNGSGGRVLPAITLDVAGGNECLLFVEVAVVRLTLTGKCESGKYFGPTTAAFISKVSFPTNMV